MARQLRHSLLGSKGTRPPIRQFTKPGSIYYNKNLNSAPVGVNLHVRAWGFGDQPIVARNSGTRDDLGAPIWYTESEDGPVRIDPIEWKHIGRH